MKKGKPVPTDELCAEYKRSDFPGAMIRGKYAQGLRESSNVVVLRPDVAAAFPNEEAVNDALPSLIHIAQAATRATSVPARHNATDT